MAHMEELMTDEGLHAAAEGGVDAFEAAWLERMESPGESAPFLEALEALPDAHKRSSAPSLLLLLLEAYQSRSAHSDIIEVIKVLYPYRPSSQGVDLRELVLASLDGQYGNEDWYELFQRIARPDEGDLLDALERFEQLVALLPGSVVYHRTGWGEGLITGLDLAEDSFKVSFRTENFERSMPFTTGLDVLTVLPAEDLRTRLMNDKEGLERDAADQPSVLLRAVARLHNGRAGAKEVKQWLCGPVVATSSWASWWRKAKVAAAQDPYIAVDNPSRPVFVLRQRALSAEDEAREAMRRSTGLASLLEVVRGPLSLEAAPEVEAAMLDALAERMEAGGDAKSLAEGHLVLARHGRCSEEDAGKRLHELSEGGSTFGALVTALKPATLRREAFEAYVVAEPTLWSDSLIGCLSQMPPHILELVADRMVSEGRGAALANRMHIMLLTPSRHAAAVLRLAKLYGKGLFTDVEQCPSLMEIFMGLLHLAETQAPRALRDDRPARDTLEGVETLFKAGKMGLLVRFGKEASRSEMERAMGVLARCRSMPDTLVGSLEEACHARFPDLVPQDETPYWDSPNIYCSRDGIARREEEHRVLIEDKIPENSETIGKAAAYGDLSENFEWTAAIEQQRQLTEKAAAMEAELKLARTIEDQEQMDGVVTPGTQVTYTENGETKVIRILGPWDAGGEGVVSYRAPVGEGMLGAQVGSTVTLELPAGAVDVTIQSVDQIL
jgi:transcription elongation factor GreA